jgi:fucose permease
MGLVADQLSLIAGFAVPLLCVLFITWSALMTLRKA